jgi:hypothetical protein
VVLRLIAYICIIVPIMAQNSPHGMIAWKCTDCHSTNGWKEMIVPLKFDHSKTSYVLNGQHKLAECVDCHSTLKFVGTSKNCYSCHRKEFESAVMPNHVRAGFGTNCERCHSSEAQSWRNSFDHNRTEFPLRGAHESVACDQCHKNGSFRGASLQCFNCHQKEYSATTNPNHVLNQFSHECLSCHTNIVWKPSIFNHGSTSFPLAGAHISVVCASCHTNGVFKGLPSDCYSCHQNNFAGTTNPNHTTSQFSHDCISCHSTTAWKPSMFNHAKTSFPLLGAHAAIVCGDCHTNGQYKGLSTVCYDCHTPDFTKTTTPSHVISQFSHDCLTCHSNLAWKPATFNHSTTSFSLVGAHASAACTDCHKNGQYKGTPTDCYSCHQTDYSATINPSHVTANFPTACVSCHSTTAWVPSTFNHALYFPIGSGDVHRPGRWTVCADCHNSASNFKVFTCITCHQHSNKTSVDRDHQGTSGYVYESNACYKCHPKGRN